MCVSPIEPFSKNLTPFLYLNFAISNLFRIFVLMKNNNYNYNYKPKPLYLVVASKGGGDTHSYIVGIYSSLSIGMSMCESEEDERGGKYTCYIAELGLNGGVPSSFISYRSI